MKKLDILKPIIFLGVMGVLFGAILAYTSQKFAVKIDERVEKILEVLPGANCGGCGFPGCGGLANAIVEGTASVNGCPVGGTIVATKIGDIMGEKASEGEKIVAKVICKGNCETAKNKYDYEGISDCRAAMTLSLGPKSCKFGCLGLGTCKDVCKFDAITIENGIAIIDEEKCVMCGKCIEICPKSVIIRKPFKQEIIVECNSEEFGKNVKEKCSVGCIGCGICAKACPVNTIVFENKIAKINFDNCIQCKICVEKCPTKVIKGDLGDRSKVKVDETKCIGCTICKKQCKFGAIEGEKKSPHKVDKSKCIGCHLCIQKCPKKAIKTI